MSESAEKKSKRTFLSYLLGYEWSFQLSLFYEDYADAQLSVEHCAALRKSLPKGFRSNAFLWRLCAKRGTLPSLQNRPQQRTLVMPYHTFFTNRAIEAEDFEVYCQRRFDGPLKVKARSINAADIAEYAKTVREQRPHNLHKLFPDLDKINRYSLINERCATSKETFSPA